MANSFQNDLQQPPFWDAFGAKIAEDCDFWDSEKKGGKKGPAEGKLQALGGGFGSAGAPPLRAR